MVFNFSKKYNHRKNKNGKSYFFIQRYKTIIFLFCKTTTTRKKNGKTKMSRKLFFILIVLNLNVRVITQHIHGQQKTNKTLFSSFIKRLF